jgi:hypothetical protein
VPDLDEDDIKLIVLVPVYQIQTMKARLSGALVLWTCLRRTTLILEWEPGITEIRDPLVCPEDVDKFSNLIVEQTGELNWITTHAAKRRIKDLRKNRVEIEAYLLIWVDCPGIVAQKRNR